eukprot:1156669-Pelagomonas_calceolata.AAC.7
MHTAYTPQGIMRASDAHIRGWMILQWAGYHAGIQHTHQWAGHHAGIQHTHQRVDDTTVDRVSQNASKAQGRH